MTTRHNSMRRKSSILSAPYNPVSRPPSLPSPLVSALGRSFTYHLLLLCNAAAFFFFHFSWNAVLVKMCRAFKESVAYVLLRGFFIPHSNFPVTFIFPAASFPSRAAFFRHSGFAQGQLVVLGSSEFKASLFFRTFFVKCVYKTERRRGVRSAGIIRHGCSSSMTL